MLTIRVKFIDASGNQYDGEFGPIADKNMATQFLAILAGRGNVVSAVIEENRVIG